MHILYILTVHGLRKCSISSWVVVFLTIFEPNIPFVSHWRIHFDVCQSTFLYEVGSTDFVASVINDPLIIIIITIY